MAYTNVPPSQKFTGSDSVIQAFNTYNTKPLELQAVEFDAITGFFTGRGFDPQAAKAIAVTIIAQAKADGYNPMIVLDSLKGLDDVTLSALVTEIINYNRFKTSFLGYSNQYVPVAEVARHVVA